MAKIAFFGAGGKMGRIISRKLKAAAHDLRCVEIAREGIDALKELGLEVVPAEEAVADAEVVAFAVPDDRALGIIRAAVPRVPSGALVIMLDPCAAHSGKLPERDDIAYFVSHPCHRSFLEADRKGQHIVTALHQGEEKDYELGVEIARTMYGPVLDVHRLTVAQMAFLEPALSETVAGACLAIIREGFDEVVRQGVPEKATYDFLMGHVTATIRVLFGHRGFFSDAAYKIMDLGKELVIREDWKDALTPESVREQVSAVVLDGGEE